MGLFSFSVYGRLEEKSTASFPFAAPFFKRHIRWDAAGKEAYAVRHELDIWIIGGDRRQVRLAGLLAEDGHTVHTLGLGPAGEGVKEEKELSGAALADCVVLPLPTAAPGGRLNAPLAAEPLTLETVFAALRPGQVICAGRVDPATQAMARDRGLVLHDYFAREELAVANAVPAAWNMGHRHIPFICPERG